MVLLPFFSPLHILEWLGVAGLISFSLIGWDKLMAVIDSERVPEKDLWYAALAGGFIGTIVGGQIFRHKIRKGYFWTPVVFAAICWAVILYLSVRGII